MSRESILKSFGAALKVKRTDRDYSQEAFAELCGFDRTYISMLERGKRNPSLVNLARIAKALKIDLALLLADIKI